MGESEQRVERPGPRRILVVGDTHGHAQFVKAAIDHAIRHECDAILQLGDFGFWPGGSGIAFLSEIGKHLRKNPIPFYVIHGNHDAPPIYNLFGIADDGFAPMTLKGNAIPNMFYIPQSSVWEWSGVRFGNLSGAVSVDRTLRKPGISWWAGERPTVEEAERLMAKGKLDVLVMHDAPFSARLELLHGKGGWPVECLADSREVSMLLDEVTRETNPKLILHGHWHLRQSIWAPLDDAIYRVEGFADNTTWQRETDLALSCGVLTLPDLLIDGVANPNRILLDMFA